MEGIDRTVVFHARNGHEILTKEDAKREALAMWRWLMWHPTKGKAEYCNTFGISYDDWLCTCALCEYGSVKIGVTRHSCKGQHCLAINCPLSRGVKCGCELGEGIFKPPYYRWECFTASPAKKFFAAMEIVIRIKAW